jgi:sugar phosphate isomerase/epimerase
MTSSIPPIAFSTLACPDWRPSQVVEAASEAGYDAIEWRAGEEGHVRTTMPPPERKALVRQMADAGIASLAVTAYSTFTSPDAATRAANASDLLAHARLAADLGAPWVRTFIGFRQPGIADATMTAGIVDALLPVADASGRLGVGIAIEPHDDFVVAPDVAALLSQLRPAAIGVVWDIGNAWAAGERPEEGLAILAPWIRWVQLKDGVGRDDTWRLTRLGDGEVPLLAALRGLAALGPLPPLSLEWERAWHPELDEPQFILGPARDAIARLALHALGAAPGRGQRDRGATTDRE